MSHDTQFTLQVGVDACVGVSDFDDRHVHLQFTDGDFSFSLEMTLQDVLAIRNQFSRIAEEVFQQDSSIKCEGCGYTWYDADFHGDHRNCRRYPFFPNERGKSHAINR